MSYGTSYPGFAFPKSEPRPVAKQRSAALLLRIDLAGSAAVRRRSGSVCELPGCRRRADHVHHLLSGYQRGRGKSALASHKLHICADDHRAIHDHRIRLTWDAADPFETLRVERGRGKS